MARVRPFAGSNTCIRSIMSDFILVYSFCIQILVLINARDVPNEIM
jgi:hypothetical protein